MKCQHCEAQMVEDREYKNRGTGCLICLVGLLLSPLLLGIPILLYGLYYSGQPSGLWTCSGCRTTLPRAISSGEGSSPCGVVLLTLAGGVLVMVWAFASAL